MNQDRKRLAQLAGLDGTKIPAEMLEMANVFRERRKKISPGTGELPVELLLIIYDKFYPAELEVSGWKEPVQTIRPEGMVYGGQVKVSVEGTTYDGIYLRDKGAWHLVTLEDDPDNHETRSVRKSDIQVA